MFTISVEFLLGTFRGDPDGTANTGGLEQGEWPPAPARLFAAFVASDGSGKNCRVTDGSELCWLESLPPPVIRAVSDIHHQSLRPRYVVRHEGTASRSTHQGYVGRTGTLVRQGVRVALRDSRVVYEWDDEPPATVLEGLRCRAARIGYLGASDSPVRIAVAAGERLPGPSDAFVPDPDGEITIAVPKSGDLLMLDQMHAQWTERGASVSRSQFPAVRHDAWYRSPTAAKRIDHGNAVAWLALRPAQPGRRVSAVTALFKEAVLSRHQRMHGEPSPLLHGHGFKKGGYELARYLALPDVGGPLVQRTAARPCSLAASRHRCQHAKKGPRCRDGPEAALGTGRGRVSCAEKRRGECMGRRPQPLVPPVEDLGYGDSRHS